ncbi:hypothetical protein SEA_AOKA_37 [Arthrobacter phage Aoka]|nr:hypothetical protein SEA_AOKA_37 [Arthrobacter phage Aoka]
MTTETTTEQEWLGNNSFAFRAEPRMFECLDIGPRFPLGPDPDAEQAAAARRAAGEAALLAGMKRALRPFPRLADSPVYPRAGVRIRPDGRFQVRIWLDPTLPDPVQGGPCETLAEACNIGALICSYARDAA